MSKAEFVHLHNHSEYSLLDGAFRIEDMVSRARKMGMNAVALTDHGNMFGVVPFYREASRAGIKPIIGMEAYLARDGIGSRGAGAQSRNDHLVLLVKNREGYRNLIRLSSLAYTEGFYYKPRIDLEILKKYSGGLIGMSACLKGTIPQLLLENRRDQAESFAREIASVFEEGDFYIELQNHGIDKELKVLPELAGLASRVGLPTVVTNDCHFSDGADHQAHDVLLCLQTSGELDDENRKLRSNPETYFKSAEQMRDLFSEHPEAISNTLA
ncbi:MAG: PHP domain-containing protein, partial [Candidatus Latescibacteria bacterium]|nr:PHP domain-containing protein [Candidatus Latescibacterota bacterium]